VNIRSFYKVFVLGFLLQLFAVPLTAAESANGSNSAYDQSGVSEILDSLIYNTYFKDDRFSPSSTAAQKENFPRQFVPQYTDSVYASRIASLAKKTKFKLIYNEHVKGFIRVYAVDKRKLTGKILGLTKMYFPLFEEKLLKYNIPTEMKYLAVVESALNPIAVSHAGARGLWQFMYGTGKMYGLQSSSIIEDRFDPYKSTEAACKHLRDLHDTFGDWFLALAAYNSGAGTVNRAIRQAGGVKDYWAIWPYLPQETRGYVPAFIAVTYVMNFYREHNIIPAEPGYFYSDTDTVRVSNALSFDQLTETIGVPMEELKLLNPQYKVGLVPGSASPANIVTLPKRYMQQFRQRENEIYAYKSSRTQERQQLLSLVQDQEKEDPEPKTVQTGTRQKVHVVRRGETLASISRTYRAPVSQLIEWNDLKRPSVKPGQRIIVLKVSKPEKGTERLSRRSSKSRRSLKASKSSKSGVSVKTVTHGKQKSGRRKAHK
jgi:membrane-bound lytic murein transglycosylase D